MPRTQAILVPTDFSAASEQALEYAVRLAERFGAMVHLLHVVDGLSPTSSEGRSAALPDGYFEHLEHQIRARLGVLLCKVVRGRVPAIRATRMGDPAREIVSYARECRIDLIVLPRSAHGHVAQLFLGSVADKILRSAPCPVVTLTGRAERNSGGGVIGNRLGIAPACSTTSLEDVPS